MVVETLSSPQFTPVAADEQEWRRQNFHVHVACDSYTVSHAVSLTVSLTVGDLDWDRDTFAIRYAHADDDCYTVGQQKRDSDSQFITGLLTESIS